MRIPVLLPSLILVGGLLSACGGEKKPTKAAAAPAEAGKVPALSAPDFEALLAQDKPVLVDFWAPWCGPCKTQGPLVDQAAAQMGDRARVGKVNVDEERDLAKRYRVEAIPTLIIFKGGKEVRRFVGVQQPGTLVKALGE